MFTLDKLTLRHAMAAKKITAAELARRAGLPATAFDDLDFCGVAIEFRDFEPLVKLGKVLGCTPFELLESRG